MAPPDDIMVAHLVVNRKAAESSGDGLLLAMCTAGLALYDRGCRTSMCLPGGGRVRLPLAIAVTAAKLAAAGRSEAEWRSEFTQLMLDAYGAHYPSLIVLLIDGCIREQRAAGLWPWRRAGANTPRPT